jgi:hypothetical protein
MALDPEVFITLTRARLAEVREAVLRAMADLPKERKGTTIVRKNMRS